LVFVKVYRWILPKEPSAARHFKQVDSESGLRQDDSHEWIAKVLSALGGRFFPYDFSQRASCRKTFQASGFPKWICGNVQDEDCFLLGVY